jgi:hypothetical protein
MPRDVSTRWNSTFDMLDFAITYRVAIDAMTAAREFDLRKYELLPDEWKIATELRQVLEVSVFFFAMFCFHSFLPFRLDLQTSNFILLSWHPQPSCCHPRDGPYQQGPHCVI